MTNLLTIHNVSKTFGSDNHVLNTVSIHVNEGEFVSILGPSGSGKSTLFHLIGGMLSPDKGEIYLHDNKINGQRGHISYMPQQPSLLPWRTVLDNVVLSQELYGKKDKEKAKNLLDKVGLAEFVYVYPHELSGGMKQRVAFIRALLSPQALLCLDEPFSALDEFTRLEMQQWLLSIWEKKRRSILFITHNIEEALLLSDRIYILSNRPATVIKEIIVPFKRPRTRDLLLKDELLQWKREVFHALMGEGNIDGYY
jgi:ABC-type nitrate/sulfonate/bicarbonate transport system ATPase subunit